MDEDLDAEIEVEQHDEHGNAVTAKITNRERKLRANKLKRGRPLTTANVFRPLLGIDPSSTLTIVTLFVNGLTELSELHAQADKIRTLMIIRDAFCETLDLKTWEQARKTHPTITTQQNLFQWLRVFQVL